MTVNINKPQINLREQLNKLERPTTDKLAVKGHDGILIDPLTGELSLQGIEHVTSESGDGDVFVYDTSKDSDGGAWRKRTQGTSWYTETLGTATRGSKKEFPAVAVIVAQDDELTIYDGDKADLPMWMKWTSTVMLRGAGQRKIAAMNGIIALSGEGTYAGLIVIYFVSDTARSYRALASSNNSEGYWLGPGIASRNDYSSNNYSNVSGGNVLPTIVKEDTRGVAMSTRRTAPIDPSTGLPVPTIAVATNGGTSVIKDDGTVVDFNDALGSTRPISTVVIRGNDIVHWNINNGTIQQFFDALSATADSVSDVKYNYTAGGGHATCENVSAVLRGSGDGPYHIVTRDSKSIAAGAQPGMSVFVDGDDRTFSTNNHSIFDSRVAYITSDYNTGWMHGDIRLSTLSDTTNDPAGAPLNIVSNGTFDNNIDGWGLRGSGIEPTHSNGKLQLTGNSTWHVINFTRNYNFIAGEEYFIKFTMEGSSSRGVVDYSGGVLTPTTGAGYYYPSAAGTYTVKFVPNSTTPDLAFVFYNTSGSTGTLDDVSITPAIKDRSLKASCLAVHGTVARSRVNPNADLVAYGGFSNNNYIRQAYSSNLIFGGSDFSIMFWIYDTGVNEHTTIISKDEREFDISRLGAAFGSKLRIYTRNSSEDLRAPDSASALPFNKWTHVCVTYTGGNTKNVYIDGKLDNTITGTNGEYDIDNTSYGLNIGVRNTGGATNYAATGIKLALLRISGTAPSAQQIKEICEDEKDLFQENSKAVFYGSHDAVNCLDFDSSTSLLHVGTASGRSTFSGLKRVENTTIAVTTAIGASNGLVAEL